MAKVPFDAGYLHLETDLSLVYHYKRRAKSLRIEPYMYLRKEFVAFLKRFPHFNWEQFLPVYIKALEHNKRVDSKFKQYLYEQATQSEYSSNR